MNSLDLTFQRLDTVVAIEFQRASCKGPILFSPLRGQVKSLDEQTLLAIKSIYPGSYELKRVDQDITLDVDDRWALMNQLEQRSDTFKGLWKEAMKGKPKSMAELVTYRLARPKSTNSKPIVKLQSVRVSKPGKTTTKRICNTSSKFQFHEKVEQKGSTILERIRTRQKQAGQLESAMAQRKSDYIDTKRRVVYDVIFTETPHGKARSFTMDELFGLVNVSNANPIDREDLEKVVSSLSKALKGVRVVQVGDVQVVKVIALDRDGDLAKIE